MKTKSSNKFTLKHVIWSIQQDKQRVKSYMESKHLPKYIGDAMIEQLENAITKGVEDKYNEAYCYMLAYYDIKNQYAEGRFTSHGEPPTKVLTNRWFHDELSLDSSTTSLLGLAWDTDDRLDVWRANEKVYVRLLDCMKKFQVKVSA